MICDMLARLRLAILPTPYEETRHGRRSPLERRLAPDTRSPLTAS